MRAGSASGAVYSGGLRDSGVDEHSRVESRIVIPIRRNRGGGRVGEAVKHGEESPAAWKRLASRGGDFSSCSTAPTRTPTPAVPPIRNDSRPLRAVWTERARAADSYSS